MVHFMFFTLLPSYAAPRYSYVTCMLPYGSQCIRMLLVCIRTLLMCTRVVY